MNVDRETYRAMNKGYNALFDGWKQIEGMPAELDQAMNAALVLLDGVLDQIKAALPAQTVAAGSAAGQGSTAAASGFTVFGGK